MDYKTCSECGWLTWLDEDGTAFNSSLPSVTPILHNCVESLKFRVADLQKALVERQRDIEVAIERLHQWLRTRPLEEDIGLVWDALDYLRGIGGDQ